jgi:colicin import membrane protein
MAEKFANEADRADARRSEAQKKPATQTKSATPRKNEPQQKAAADKSRPKAKPADDTLRAEQRRADEADMLARARREADEMRARDEHARLAEEARQLIMDAERARANAEALLERERRLTTENRIAEPPPDADMRRREAAEAEVRRAAGQAAERERARAVEQERLARVAEKERRARAVEEERIARVAEEERRTRVAEEERLAQLRHEETRRLIEKLNRVRQIRDARLATQSQRTVAESKPEPPPYALGAAPPSQPAADNDRREEVRGTGVVTMAPPLPPPQPPTGSKPAFDDSSRMGAGLAPRQMDRWNDRTVSVLLIMAPGNYGIRRNGPKIADPILCAPDGCYVSEGPDRPARFLPGHRALSFGNTWGARAGACRGRLGCVFRGIELGNLPAYLQPVDMHILRHDRRRPQQIVSDSGCRADSGRLVCGRGIYADDYALWIVPERVADTAGPAALERAVAEGLNGPRSADVFPLLGR